jgi:hypothetical protein
MQVNNTEILISEPAVRDLAETIVRRLDAGIVDGDQYLAEMLETLERKCDAIAEALHAGELQPDQAKYSHQIAERQIELVVAVIRGRAHDAALAGLETRSETELEL